ncbi:MAG: hypothetical protein IJH63_11760 [Methanobrevibacter sp.]|nr:hypothetical protein [Methanobrevibacter sp.]
MEFPEFFDPFNEYCPDFSGYMYDFDDGMIKSPEGEVLQSPATSICNEMAEQGNDPNPTLKELLEAEFNKNKPEVMDPADTLPDQPYCKIGDRFLFKDSSFARSVLTSEQSCKNKDLKGWVIMPANQISAIRSRTVTHQKCYPLLWLPEDQMPPEIRAIFGQT